MAKHMDTIDEACKNLWKMLDTLNSQNQSGSKDAEQYHDVVASLYKLHGLKMAEQAEEEDGNSYRGSYAGGGRGRSMMYYDPYIYGNTYRGGSYGGEDWEDMDGVSGARYRRRDNMGRFSRDGGSYEGEGRGGRGGNSRNGGSYGGAAEHLKNALREAHTEEEREAIRRAMREVDTGM